MQRAQVKKNADKATRIFGRYKKRSDRARSSRSVPRHLLDKQTGRRRELAELGGRSIIFRDHGLDLPLRHADGTRNGVNMTAVADPCF